MCGMCGIRGIRRICGIYAMVGTEIRLGRRYPETQLGNYVSIASPEIGHVISVYMILLL
jgi:hypothetical protein